MTNSPTAVIMGGIPATNLSLYHRLRFMVGDPVAYVAIEEPAGSTRRTMILRDIEIDRARASAKADEFAPYAQFAPEGGLSGDREVACAQALAECLARAGVRQAVADRTLPLGYAEQIRSRGIELACDPDLGIADRRRKDTEEIENLRHAQSVTEDVMRRACETVGSAHAASDGSLTFEGEPLTSERLQRLIAVWCLERGASCPHGCIVASGPIGADCHHRGAGPIKTGEPVIIDIFPLIGATHYNGDCTRGVVHGQIPPELDRMHRAVVEAKDAAEAMTKAGVTGEQVHHAAVEVIERHGYATGLPGPDADPSFTSMVHGTGHGIGLDVHEPPLLDKGGPELVVGDCLTIEPGLYSQSIGGVRIEDMVVVTPDGCQNLNRLPTGLTWA